MLNSLGTRTWVNWAQAIPPSVKVHLYECPMLFVKSFTMVKGFLRDNMQVQSFYVPFYSPETDENINFLAVRGVNFDDTGVHLPKPMDSKGNAMEFDAGKNYLSFIKTKR